MIAKGVPYQEKDNMTSFAPGETIGKVPAGKMERLEK